MSFTKKSRIKLVTSHRKSTWVHVSPKGVFFADPLGTGRKEVSEDTLRAAESKVRAFHKAAFQPEWQRLIVVKMLEPWGHPHEREGPFVGFGMRRRILAKIEDKVVSRHWEDGELETTDFWHPDSWPTGIVIEYTSERWEVLSALQQRIVKLNTQLREFLSDGVTDRLDAVASGAPLLEDKIRVVQPATASPAPRPKPRR